MGRFAHDHRSCRRRLLSFLSSPPPSELERSGIHLRRQNIHACGSQELRGPALHDLTHFRSILSRPDRSIMTTLNDGALQMSSDSHGEELARYNQDWTGQYRGSSPLVLRPTNTSEVASILRYCHDNFIGIVPQGGNTGLCGGATPLHDEVIVSLEGMNKIYRIDVHSGILTCDAGAILQICMNTQMNADICYRWILEQRARVRLAEMCPPTLAGSTSFDLVVCMAQLWG